MTVHDIATRLLAHFSPEEREIPDNVTYPGRNAAVMGAINGALEELFGEGGPWVRRDERGRKLHEPTVVNLTVTADSNDAEIAEADWQDWMSGCTLVIAGSSVDNQIRNDARQARLKFAHDGPTGATTATVYHDSIDLGDDVLRADDPVRIDRNAIQPITSPHALVRGRSESDFGFHRRTSEPTFIVGRVSDTAARPIAYCVETWSADATSAAKTRMRLYPAPSAPVFLDYSVQLAPPVVDDLAAEIELPVPFQFVDTLLMPLATKRLSSSPFWRDGRLEEVDDAYERAKLALAKLKPSKNQGRRFIPGH